MSDNNVASVIHPANNHSFSCIVCGSSMYVTDHGNHEVTFHCSSNEARFWDFDRGTWEQTQAKEHWDKSKKEVFPDLEADVKTILNNKPASPENN